MARKEHYLVSLDVGTSKVAAVVAESREDEGLDIIGIGVAEAEGCLLYTSDAADE